MPSPFPGMNPYLEREGVFHDFHQSFIPVARRFLTRQLAPTYVAKVCLAWSGAVDVEPRAYLEIWDCDRNELVTVVELLTPSCKALGTDREHYLNRRGHLLRSGVQLMEIDLLRAGLRVWPGDLPDRDYGVSVRLAGERPRVCLWPWHLRYPLPMVPVPLRAPDAHVGLDLQSVLHAVYDDAGYQHYIYREAPQPPLCDSDVVWTQQFLPRTDEGGPADAIRG